jgi:hypothetical protein
MAFFAVILDTDRSSLQYPDRPPYGHSVFDLYNAERIIEKFRAYVADEKSQPQKVSALVNSLARKDPEIITAMREDLVALNTRLSKQPGTDASSPRVNELKEAIADAIHTADKAEFESELKTLREEYAAAEERGASEQELAQISTIITQLRHEIEPLQKQSSGR